MKIMSKLAAVTFIGFAMSQPSYAHVGFDTAANTMRAGSGPSAGAIGNPAKKYCIREETPTGSRLAKTVCRTKAEWLADGVEIQVKK